MNRAPMHLSPARHARAPPERLICCLGKAGMDAIFD
jgi:hypothetical protein